MPAPAVFSRAIMRTTMSKSTPKSESTSKSAPGPAGDARSPQTQMEMNMHDRDLEFPPLDLDDDFFCSFDTNPDTDTAIQSAWPPTPPPHIQAAPDVDPRWSSSPSQCTVQMPPQHLLQLQGTPPLPPVDKVHVDALTAALALAIHSCDPSDVQTDHLVMPFRLPYNFGHLPLPVGCLPQHLFGADQLVQVGTTLFSVIQQALNASSHEHSPTHARDLIRAVNALPIPPELHQQLLAQSLPLCNVFLDGAAASSHNHQAPLLLQQQLGHLARAWVETQLTRVSDIPSSIDQVQAQASRHDLPGWPLALLRQEQPSQALCLVLLLTQPLPPPSPLLSEPAPYVPDIQQPQYTQQPSPALSSSSVDHMQLTPPQPQANMTDQAMATAVGDQRTFPSPLSPTASTSGAVAPRPPPPPAYRRRRRYPDDFERQMKDFHVAIRKALEGQGHIPLKLLNTRFPLIFAHHTNSLIMHPTSRRELADMLYTTLHDFSLSDKQRDLIYAWKGCNRNPLMPFQFLRRMLQERIDRATRRSGPVLKDVTDFKLPRHRALVTDVLGDLVLEWCEWNWNVFGGDAVEPRPHTGLSLVRHGDGSGVALIICIMDADGKPTVPLKMQLAMEDQARRKESKKLKANEARRRRRSAKASGDQGRTSRRSSWSSRADRDCTIRFFRR
ncbi:hypothetical protein BCR44DRAFT_1146848 [Catenaria anguillulae PL171]|uniref:Uncharacterized protein n=1 Tax=Catenaria anguillulae PL171 TaxID=765915 RepID=A0A1Y2HIW2_9FUNG|nr:hypothetical protein BCR44DRAFT_1146848 [Catenaria anguillulae PL171]